jgi:hypothetical protein
MNPRLAILSRQMQRQTEKIPAAPETGLGASIEALVQQAVKDQVADALEERHSSHTQRMLDQFSQPKPAPVRQLPPAKTPKVIESVVVQRDELGRIKKMVSKPTSGDGPTFEMTVAQRDENGHITRMVTSQIDDTPLPDPGALR